MVSLQQYIRESIFDDDDELYKKTKASAKRITIKAEKDAIRDFISQNYVFGRIKISDKRNKDGKYEVSTIGDLAAKPHIKELTNGDFVWTSVGKTLSLNSCDIKNLTDAPKTVGGSFKLMLSDHLESLEGCPESIGKDFYISHCKKLKTLDYISASIGGRLHIGYCDGLESLGNCSKRVSEFSLYDLPKLKDLKGCPEEVEADVYIRDLPSLTSLKYFPKKAGYSIHIYNCPIKSLKGVCFAPVFSVQKTNITDLEGMMDAPADKRWHSVDLCFNEKLKSLKGAPKEVWNLELAGCDSLTEDSFDDAPYIAGRLTPPHGWSYYNLPKKISYVTLN